MSAGELQLPDVFLSYASQDRDRTRLFAHALEAEGFTVWWDAAIRSGDSFDEAIEEALRSAKAVIVLWSQNSVKSRWVRAEATLADRNRTLLPCMIEPCERPIMFELTQTPELSHWQGAADDAAWLAFLADVNRFVSKDAPTRPAGPASPTPATETMAAKGERGEIPSLAVMPFTNRSGLPADDALAYGMVEDVVAALSLVSNLRVLASGSTMSWAGKPTDLRVVGRDLGVRYVIEGNLRRAEANLRVTVQLVEAETGAILWTQKFDRPLSELADLQEELVTEVSNTLGLQVQSVEIARALAKPGNLTAYEAGQRSFSVFMRLSLASLPFAETEARRAIALAPDYALGHAMLAFTLGGRFLWGGGKDETLRVPVRQHASRAIALASTDPMALSFAAGALNYFDLAPEVLRNGRRAVELAPNLYYPRVFLAMIEVRHGLNDEALANLDRTIEMAPNSGVQYNSHLRQADAHFQAGRVDKAVEAIEHSHSLNPDYASMLVVRAGLFRIVGRPQDTQDVIRHLRRIEPATSVDIFAARHLCRANPTQSAPVVDAFREAWDATPFEAPAQ